MSGQTDPDGESGHNEREKNRTLYSQQFRPKKRYTGRHKPLVEEPMLAAKDTYYLGPLSWCDYYKPGCQPQPQPDKCSVVYCGIQTGTCAFLPDKQKCPLVAQQHPDALAELEHWQRWLRLNESEISDDALDDAKRIIGEEYTRIRAQQLKEAQR